MSDALFGELLASAQGGLADVPTVHDYRAKRVLILSAGVQARCAEAVALHQLAASVDRLVDVLTEERHAEQVE